MRHFFIDDSGKPSLSRALMALMVAGYAACAVIATVRTGTIPDIPINVAGVVALLYGVNKFSPTHPFPKDKEA